MPGIYLSDPPATGTSTAGTSPPPSAPAITSITAPGDFQMGINTCGFTSESTITCSFGSECTDVGSYRGCCVAGATDCVSTIYTTCVDYGRAVLSGDCGDHTLCCPATMPSCFSYGYMSTAAGRSDATLTHVQCHETAGFGEMFPYPPEAFTTTMEDAPSESTAIGAQPTDDDPSTSGSAFTGVIVGAVVGVVALLLLIGLAAFLVIRRRRQRAAAQGAGTGAGAADAGMVALPPRDKESSDDSSVGGGKQEQKRPAHRLRPLSTIQEQPSPIATTTATTTSPLSAGAAATRGEKPKSARRSHGPAWPLGSGNPLASNPVDREKRLSDPAAGTGSSGSSSNADIPQLQPRPPPGTGLPPPPPPPPKPPRSSSSARPHTPTTISAGLQSPRLSYVPVSPIDAAFREEVDRRFDGGSGEGGRDRLGIGFAIGRTPSSRSTRSITNISNSSRRISALNYQQQQQEQEQEQQHEPVSPIDDEDDEEGEEDADLKRFSFVSAPSIPGEGAGNPDLVSPISPDFSRRSGSGDTAVSPATVSPVESRRESLADR